MPYTFKLAQRVARFGTGKLLTATLLCVACNAGDDPAGSRSLDPTVPGPDPSVPAPDPTAPVPDPTVPAPPPSPPPPGNLPTPLRTVNVATTSQLKTAIESALPGDRIVMAPGSYTLGFYSGPTRSGTATNPIVLTGPRTAVFTGTTLLPDASYWWFNGFRITASSDYNAIMHVGGNYNIYEYLELDHTGSAGIAIKTGLPGAPSSSETVTGNVIRYNSIHDTGLFRADYGEGIYLGDGTVEQRALNTHVHHNTIGPNIRAEAIEAKVLTDGNRIEFNTLSSYVVVRSKNNVFNDNIISGASPSGALINNASDVPGTQASNNTYHRNTATYSGTGKMFFVYGGSGNLIYCDNVVIALTVLGVTCTQ